MGNEPAYLGGWERWEMSLPTWEVGSDGVPHVFLVVSSRAWLQVDEDARLVGRDLVDEDWRRLHEHQFCVVINALGAVLQHQAYKHTLHCYTLQHQAYKHVLHCHDNASS